MSAEPRLLAVTGASGFIGQHLLRELAARGEAVRVLARRRRRAAVLPGPPAIVQGDLANTGALAGLVEGADTVIHLAGAIGAPSREQFLAVNVAGTRNLHAAALRAGVRRFVHMSSLAAREPRISAYAETKAMAEEALLSSDGDISIAMLRAPAVYGPGDRATLPLLRELTHRVAFVPSSAAARFSLLYAGDLARIISDACDEHWTGVREADDGAANGYCWQDLADAIEQIEGRRPRLVFMPRACVSSAAALIAGVAGLAARSGFITTDKVRQLYHPDWVSHGHRIAALPPTGLSDGLARTLAWYRAEGWLPPARPVDKKRLRSAGGRVL